MRSNSAAAKLVLRAGRVPSRWAYPNGQPSSRQVQRQRRAVPGAAGVPATMPARGAAHEGPGGTPSASCPASSPPLCWLSPPAAHTCDVRDFTKQEQGVDRRCGRAHTFLCRCCIWPLVSLALGCSGEDTAASAAAECSWPFCIITTLSVGQCQVWHHAALAGKLRTGPTHSFHGLHCGSHLVCRGHGC